MRYEILDAVNGNVVNTIDASEDFCAAHYPFYRLAVDQPNMSIPSVRTLTKLAYMNRFTDAELAAIYTAAKSNVQVEVWLDKFKIAEEINLDDTSTIAGVQALEAAGLLAKGRSAEILA
jgi:hypothetical protein